MRRTILTLATLVGLTAICATTTQAGTSMAIAGGLASQTLAKHGHGHHGGHHGGHWKHGGHHGGHWKLGGHHGGHWKHGGHHGGHWKHGYVPYNGFYYSGNGFSFGFGY